MAWANSGTKYTTAVTGISNPFSLVSYQTNSGYAPDEDSIGFKAGYGFSCHTILNRRCFIGNIKTKDAKGVDISHEDRVMYSEPGKFDVFPSYNYIDLEIGDGDSVQALAGFADRLFVFKRKALYVVNVANATDTGWFLENTLVNKGVYGPYAIADTDEGIAWVNESGLYYFNGENITELSQKMDKTTWGGNISYRTMLGYDPIKKHLIVLFYDDNKNGYIFDFNTMSFTQTTSIIVQSASDISLTNFHTDRYGELVILTDTTDALEEGTFFWGNKELSPDVK